MSISSDYDGPLKPQVGARDIGIPITIEYSGGRFQANRSRILWTIISIIGIIIVTIGILLSDSNFLLKMLLTVVFLYLSTAAVRFLLLKEHKYRAEMVEREENDLRIRAANFWGIYRISENDYCYFRNGWVGLFVMLEKAPIIGKTEADKFDHYEAIADAFNILATSKLRVCHIDMMDFIGRDSRTQRALMKLSQNDSEDMHVLLDAIFKNLQDIAESSRTSYDIYLFMSKTNEDDFEKELSRVLSCFLEANYSTYEILNRQQIKTIAQSLFNLNDFSINDAIRQAFRKESSSARIVPISLERDGKVVEVFNSTVAQAKAEAEQKAELRKEIEKERQRRRQEAKSRGKRTKSGEHSTAVKTPETLIDFNSALSDDAVFDATGEGDDFYNPKASADFDDTLDPLSDDSPFIDDSSTGAFLESGDLDDGEGGEGEGGLDFGVGVGAGEAFGAGREVGSGEARESVEVSESGTAKRPSTHRKSGSHRRGGESPRGEGEGSRGAGTHRGTSKQSDTPAPVNDDPFIDFMNLGTPQDQRIAKDSKSQADDEINFTL